MSAFNDPVGLQQPNILGQTVIETYTVVLLGFKLPETSNLPLSPSDATQSPAIAAIATIKTALHTLRANFPHVAGQIKLEGRSESPGGSSGTYKVVPYPISHPHLLPESWPTIKDLRNSSTIPPLSTILSAKAPSFMLPAFILAPLQGSPKVYDPRIYDCPVFAAQATLIPGDGLILGLAGQHNVMDFNGMGKLIGLLAKACRGESFSNDEIAAGRPEYVQTLQPLLTLREDEELWNYNVWRRESRLKPLEKPTGDLPALAGTTSASAGGQPNEKSGEEASWRYVRFTREQLVKLKQEASLPLGATVESDSTTLINAGGEKQSQSQEPVEWVSTNDALTAFVWSRITAARLTCHPSLSSLPSSPPRSSTGSSSSSFPSASQPPTTTKIIRVLSALGRRPETSQAYIGPHAIPSLSPAYPAHTLPLLPLNTVARGLRSSLTRAASAHSLRSWATFLLSQRDKSTVSIVSPLVARRDLIVSSWASVPLYALDFGGVLGGGRGGRVEFVRRPDMLEARAGTVYFMPMDRAGAVDGLICLAEGEWAALRRDGKWREVVVDIG